jgi:hypothetical protein
MGALPIPPEVEEVFQNFFTCEFTTLGKNHQPVSWPIFPLFWPERMKFALLTPIGLAKKAANIRRNPRVSLLFSNPTGSELANPPAVLVQGKATVSEKIFASLSEYDEDLLLLLKQHARKLLQRQPAVGHYMLNPFTRYLMDWYFMRLLITITPQRISWWQAGDFSCRPTQMEL